MSSHTRPAFDENQRAALAASLVPVAAFIAAVLVADVWFGYTSGSLRGLVSSLPFLVATVAAPSFLAINAARDRSRRIMVTGIVTVTAITAAVFAVTSEDAQAGLWVLLVAYVAVPLAVVVWAYEAIREGRRRQ